MRSKGDEKEMKRIKGGTKIIKGQVRAGTYNGIKNKIQLFDGKYTTGYRVVEFRIMDNSPTGAYEHFAKLSTEPISGIAFLNMTDNTMVATAGWGIPASNNGFTGNLVIADNMIIEDLYISDYSTTDNRVANYYIVLEKYEFTAWDGAATLVRNQSQDVS